MQRLILTRGIPASGKSTWAKEWVKASAGRVRINRDDIRKQLFGQLTNVDEALVTKVEDSMIRAALKAGASVVVDATHIPHRYIRRVYDLGDEFGVQAEIKEFPIDLDEALRRNKARFQAGGTFVPESVIKDMHKRLQDSGPYLPEPISVKPYVPGDWQAKAIMVDIDGTLAKMSDRSPYDWHRVGEDIVVEAVRTVVKAMDASHFIVVMSGRDSVCREATEKWLEDNDIPFDDLFMRPKDDMRKDSIVKRELFDNYVRHVYNVEFVLDDRNQVVDMWRRLGLTCFQVAEGNF